MYQTKKELRVKLKLAERRIKTLEDRLQAARDVNYELRQDLTEVEIRLNIQRRIAEARQREIDRLQDVTHGQLELIFCAPTSAEAANEASI